MNQEIIKKIRDFSQREGLEIYLVGGFVRDLAQGKTSPKLDMDFIMEGEKFFPFIEKLAVLLQGTLIVLDKENQVYRIVLKVKEQQQFFDFTPLRGKTLRGDLEKRDFTINSMALRLEDYLKHGESREKILDPLKGLSDLKRGIIRRVSPEAFMDDPQRLLRGIRFCAQLNFRLEEGTKREAKKNSHLIKGIAGERIREELWKIMEVDHSYPWIILLEEDLGLLGNIFPKIKEMRLTAQNLHHGENVWNHSLRTYKYVEEFLEAPPFREDLALKVKRHMEEEIIPGRKIKSLLKFFALFHDVGKVPTKKVTQRGKVTFYGHENAGTEVIEKIGKRLKLSSLEIKTLKKLMKHHMRPLFLYLAKNRSPRATFRFFHKTGDEGVEVLFHSAADFISKKEAKGKGLDDFKNYKSFLEELLDRYFYERDRYVDPFPLVNGRDLMRELSIKPSPLLGYLLKKISEAQAEGRIKNRKEAIELAGILLKNRH